MISVINHFLRNMERIGKSAPITALLVTGCTLYACTHANKPSDVLPPNTIVPVVAKVPDTTKDWELICTEIKGRIIAKVPNKGKKIITETLTKNDSDKPSKVHCAVYSEATGNELAAFIKFLEPKQSPNETGGAPKQGS